VLNPFFVHWSFSGMEAVSALGLSLWAVWLVFMGRPTRRRCLLAAVLLGVAPLLRPELLLFAMLVAPALLRRRWQALAGQSAGPRLLGLSILAATVVLPLCLWAGYALDAFGAIIPTTNLAKRGGSIREVALHLLSVYALGFSVTLLLLPWVRFPCLRQVPGAVWVLLLWPLACMAFYLANHTVVQSRYCLLSMPGMSIAVLWLIAAGRRTPLFAAAVAAMVSVSAAIIGLIVVPHVSNKEAYARALSNLASYLRTQVAPQSGVAVYAIGQLGFESRHRLVDIGGILDGSVVAHFGDHAATLRWAKAHGARYYVAQDPPEPGSIEVFARPVPFIGWTFHHSQYATQHRLALYELP